MTVSRQALFWGAGFLVLGLILHVLGPILLPFVVGFAVAYFLDPIVVRMEREGARRGWATLLVLLLFFALIVLVFAFIAPLVQAQLVDLVRQAPDLLKALEERVMRIMTRLSAELPYADVERLKSAAGGIAGDALSLAGELVAKLWSGGLALLNLLSLIFISPVVAFYMLRDWHRIIAKVDGWLPRDHAPTVRALAREADERIAGFLRGTALVCLCLAVFYATALTLIGLDFGLVIGLVAGLISFIPFVGAAVGFVVSVSVALVQFEDIYMVLLTAGVFLAGQALEGNILQPKLVGDRINLHPVWVIFALLAGAFLFGFVGVLLAVPTAAVIGVLARFFISQYMKSPLYRGREGGGTAP